MIHCYSYSKEMAQEYIKMGFYIGVGGVVTFKNAKKLKEVVENIPLTSIVLETDCPYMAPEPNRGKRNNSAYIRYVAEKIAELKGITYEEVVEQTEKNARRDVSAVEYNVLFIHISFFITVNPVQIISIMRNNQETI